MTQSNQQLNGELSYLLKERDFSSFDVLYNQYVPRLRSYITRIVDNPSTAEDLVQDVILKVMLHLEQFQPGTNFNAWIYKIARNTTTNYIRRAIKERNILEEEMHQSDLNPCKNPEKTYLDKEEAIVIEDFVREFVKSEFQETLVLRELHGCSYLEIAEIVGIPLGTVMSRLHRARREVRENIATILD